MGLFKKLFPRIKNKYDLKEAVAECDSISYSTGVIGYPSGPVGSSVSPYGNSNSVMKASSSSYSLSPSMNPAMQQTVCPFCKTLGCQDYADLKNIYDALDMFSIAEFAEKAWIEIHYNKRTVSAFQEHILFSSYEFSPENHDYGVYKHYFSDEKRNAIIRDTSGTLRSIEHVRMYCTEPSLVGDFEKRLHQHRVIFYVED